MDNNAVFFHVLQQDLTPAGVKYDHVKNIAQYPDQSLDTILIQDLLDYIPENETYDIIKSILSKLKEGGELHVQGTDIKKLGIAIAFDKLPSEEFRKTLYPGKNCIYTMPEVIQILVAVGLNVTIKKYINVVEYYLVANK